jgi:AraC-like DNA-binding protein
MIVAICDNLLNELKLRVGIPGEIRALLLRDIANPPTLADIAKLLDVSDRSLRRQLREQGISFRGLLDELRTQIALKYLHTTKIRTRILRWRSDSATRQISAAHFAVGRTNHPARSERNRPRVWTLNDVSLTPTRKVYRLIRAISPSGVLASTFSRVSLRCRLAWKSESVVMLRAVASCSESKPKHQSSRLSFSEAVKRGAFEVVDSAWSGT